MSCLNAEPWLLEPGGYLQWVEYDPVSFKVVAQDPSLKQSANEKHVEIIRGPQGKATECVEITYRSNRTNNHH